MRQGEHQLRVIKALLAFQFVGAFLAGCLGALWGSNIALNSVVGAGIAWLPNCYFAFRAFRYQGAQAARKIVSSFYSGLAGKILLTGALFAVAFVKLDPLHAPAVFAGFIFVQMFNWIVPLAMGKKSMQRAS